MRFRATAHRQRTAHAKSSRIATADHVHTCSLQKSGIRLVEVDGRHQSALQSQVRLIKIAPGPGGAIQFAQQPRDGAACDAGDIPVASLVHPWVVSQHVRAPVAEVAHTASRPGGRRPLAARIDDEHCATVATVTFPGQDGRGARVDALAGRRQIQKVEVFDLLESEQARTCFARANEIVIGQFASIGSCLHRLDVG